MLDLEVKTIDKDAADPFFEEEINLFHDQGTDAGMACGVCECDVCLQAEV